MNKISNLLVFGATGTQGHPVVDAALEAGLDVFAVSRDGDKAEELLSARAQVREADLLDAEGVAEVMHGMDAAFFHLPVMPHDPKADVMVDNVLNAARASGAQRLVFTSSAWWGDGMPADVFADGLAATARKMLDSDVDTIVLRPTLYLANLVWPHVICELRDRGRLSYPPLHHRRRLNWTATEDQAAIAVACLDRAEAGEIIDVASPEALTGPELCRLLVPVYGREIHYDPQSVDEFADTLTHMAGSAEVGRTVAGLYAGIDSLKGDGPLVDTEALERRFGVRLTPVSEWVEERLGALLERFGHGRS